MQDRLTAENKRGNSKSKTYVGDIAMNYSDIKFTDMINGKGIRVTLFVSGCTHRCKGCFNKETWDSEYGVPFTEEIQENILEYFKRFDSAMQGLSLLGGDPTYYKNVEPLTEFTAEFKKRFPKKISGYGQVLHGNR